MTNNSNFKHQKNIRWGRCILFCAVCALVIGILIWAAGPGRAFSDNAHGKDSYYNLLVQGFCSGQLNVKREPPPGLEQLADPYDPKANSAYLSSVEDLSYYHGKLYLYFGITPALVLFGPYWMLTGHYLLEADAGLIFCSLGFLIAANLLYAIWRQYFSEVKISIVLGCIFIFGVVIGAHEIEWLYCRVYEVALSCAFAFSMLALAALWRALHESKHQIWWLLLASLSYGLAIGSRPSLLFGAVILLVPAVQTWQCRIKSDSYRQMALLLGAAIGPVMLIIFGLMLYNFQRFGNPLEFGYRYQLSILHQASTRQFGLNYFWLNFRYYFWEPFRWSSHFPFLQSLQPWPSMFGRFGPEQRYYGGIILAGFPLVWLALLAPLAWKRTLREEACVLRSFVTVLFLFFLFPR